MTSRIIKHLGLLNRKERFHLLQMVLDGGSPGSDSFRLSDEFRRSLGAKLGLTVPAGAFAAMDYQLDWIYVALHLALNNVEPDAVSRVPSPGAWFNSNQEDTDLLVAFEGPEAPGVCHLVLVEAKCEARWGNKQVQSKLDRLRRIRDALHLDDHCDVQFHWVVTSPGSRPRLTLQWPDWLQPGPDGERWQWIGMSVGPHWRAERCDDGGKPDKGGAYWRLRRGKGSPARRMG